MKFNFNKNINESIISDETYQRMVDYYTKTRQYKKLQDFIANYNIIKKRQNQPNKIIDIPNKPSDITVDKPVKELIFRGVNILDDNLSKKFRDTLITIADIHDKITDMWYGSLYEDDWDDSKMNEFEDQLTIYNKNLDYIKNNIQNVEWNSESIKREFTKYFNEVLNDDAKVWNRVYARHNNYLRYRSNRKSIVLQLGEILDGGFKSGKDNIDENIFKYFNNKCANERLYLPVKKIIVQNKGKDYKEVLRDKKVNLSFNWFKSHLTQISNDLKDLGILKGSVDAVYIRTIFDKYVKARKYAYAIFNLMTSNSEYNGYDKWHNKFIDYCDANLNGRQLEQLINAVGSEKQFEEVDDYQNIFDEESWERRGLYESWFDESLEYYQSHKDRYNKAKIHKINMVPTNANQCRVTCDGINVYANATFYPGDIIEICPTKKIDKSALYSRDMRESVFEVVPNEEWVLPYGYCRYYLSDAIDKEANCTYIWDPIKRVIVIKAINKIPKYSKLLLQFNI